MNYKPIIVVDDDIEDLEMINDAVNELSLTNPVLSFTDADGVLKYLYEENDKPLLILCDINMPGINGLELRKLIYKDALLRMKTIPFVFLSTSSAKQTIQSAYQLSIQGYFIKPHTYGELTSIVKEIIHYWLRCAHPNFDKSA